MLMQGYKTRFVVKKGDQLQLINIEDIICFQSKEKATFIYTSMKAKFMIDQTLEQVENLVAPEKFYRINRQFIININDIVDIYLYTNSRLKINLKNFEENEDIIVSREKVQAFKNWLDS